MYIFSHAGDGLTGDLLVADAEELKGNTTSEVYLKRIKEQKWKFGSRSTIHTSMC